MKLQHRGFTLIELIVVLVLIGVLAVSVVPRFFDASGTSEYLYRDQVLNLLRNFQMQAMQCTDDSCQEHRIIFESDKIFVGANSCPDNNTYSTNQLCIARQDIGAIRFIKLSGINSNQLRFRSNGSPRANCPSDGCRMAIEGAVKLEICIQSEGYIHPC
ncbi:MSHA pilin protein MshC [Rheinheimera pacifica]|uniref:type II secretion system protein n=1 Tax=Rheinheimera pacifica TaxID=173990 RepID=UPI00286E6BE4|nr:type II secretion system protein [Rheinheimera pacifica]MCS4308888.1 MSHA pilin protein MshC [Rheinheimera pacifica]